MVNQELVEYIKKELSKGVSQDRIQLNLFKQKWPEPEIETSLEIAKKESKKAMDKSKEEKKKKEIASLKEEVEQLKKQVAERTQKVEKEEKKTLFRKKPLLALFLSLIFVGLGQLYNGEIRKGLTFLISFIIWSIASFYYSYKSFSSGIETAFAQQGMFITLSSSQKLIQLLIVLIGIGFIVFSMVDAYIRAKAINKKIEEHI